MGSTEIDERLALLYRRMRTLTRPESDALARAGHRPRGPIERTTGFFNLDGRYRLLRGDPLERARSEARAAFKRQGHRPPNLLQGLLWTLVPIFAAWCVGGMATAVVMRNLAELMMPSLETSDMPETLVRPLITLAIGAGFLAAAVTADLLRRRSLRTPADPLDPVYLRFVRNVGLGLVAFCFFFVDLGFLVDAAATIDAPGVVQLVVVAASAALVVVSVVVVVRTWQARPWPRGALRPLRDVELALATEAIDPSVDTRLLRAAWESGVGPLDG